MKNARLVLTPMEYEYISIYRELPETTVFKNPSFGLQIVQERMDNIWESMKERNRDKEMTELKREGCPFLT